MTLPSPIQVELKLRQLELRIVERLAGSFGRLGSVPAATAFALVLAWNPAFFSAVGVSAANGGGHVIGLMRFCLPWLVLGSVLTLFQSSHRKAGLLLVNLVAWAVNCSQFFGRLPYGMALCIFTLYPGLLAWGYGLILAREGRIRKLYCWLILATVIGAFALFAAKLLALQAPQKFDLLWRLKMHYLFFQPLLVLAGSVSGARLTEQLLAPTFVAHGMLLLESTRLENETARRTLLWWHGSWNILFGLGTAALRMGLERSLDGWHSLFVRYPLHYVYAVLGIVSFLNVSVGILRIFGFAVIDATNFLWLARTPAEYWRRGSVYSFLMIQKYVFLPVLARFRSARVGRLVAFFVFINLKIGILNYLSLGSYLLGYGTLFQRENKPVRELSTAIQWSLWFLVLELSIQFMARTRVRERAGKAWLSILATHVIMASLYLWTRLIYLKLASLGWI